MLYLASAPTPDFQSYGTKILNVENSHTGSTWIGFGASFWEAEFRPVAGGNISAEYTRANMKLIFYDGGHSDWALKYENMRERVQHAAQMARETGQTNILNMVHGEDLPEYSPRAATFGPTEPPASQAQVEQRRKAGLEVLGDPAGDLGLFRVFLFHLPPAGRGAVRVRAEEAIETAIQAAWRRLVRQVGPPDDSAGR